MSAIVRQAVPSDADLLAPLLKDIDRDELYAVMPFEAHRALKLSIAVSDKSWTVEDPNGQPLAIFGVARYSEGIGCPWLLSSEDFLKYALPFGLQSRGYVEQMKQLYPKLMNYVDCRNASSIRWLSWLGFEFTGYARTYCHSSRPHLKFEG